MPSLKCGRCGEPTTTLYCENCGNPNLKTPSRLVVSSNAVNWPFSQPDWHRSLWMPFLWWFLPPLGSFFSSGWSVDAIRRKARGDAQLLPQMDDLANILKQGLVVAVMTFFYLILPVVILVALLEWAWIEEFLEFASQLWRMLGHESHESLGLFLLQGIFHLLARAIVPAIYLVAATPLFLVARLRYALTGKVRSFFNVFGNLTVCFRHIGRILLYVFLSAVTRLAIGAAGGILAITGTGLVVPLLLGAANVWILAYFAGDLATAMYEQEGIGREKSANGAPAVSSV